MVALMEWAKRQKELTALAERQLFFIGGAPRSGTTWLQHMLDCHPEVSCRGEGLFGTLFAQPIATMMDNRRDEIATKNAKLFQHTGGYPLPRPEDAEHLFATAVLLALHQQQGDKTCRAIGEKTPENVFLFGRLKALFPTAKFIGIARDPRDVLTSAWHMFHTYQPGEDENAAKLRFIQVALPSIGHGGREMLALLEQYPSDATMVTYKMLREDQATQLAALFRFLGVSDRIDIVADCVARSSFEAMSGGRRAGETRDGAFLRKGVVGDWQSTLTPEMNAIVLKEVGWMFPRFGWKP